MKYRIHTITVSIFFLLVLGGLTIDHFLEVDKNPESNPEQLELHSIMELLLLDIHTINEGVYTRNFDIIEQGARNINNHPPPASESQKLVQEVLGDRMSQFRAYDNMVHDTADSLHNAATKEDMNQVLKYYRIVEQGCVSCHAALQEEILRERLQRDIQKRE